VSSTLTLGQGVKSADQATARAVPARKRPFHITSPRKTVSAVAVYAVLALVAIFFIAPLIWLVLAAFEPAASIGSPAPLVLSFSNFAKVLNWSTTFEPLLNSCILSGATSVLTVLTALFAAYPLSRYQMRFRKPFLYTIVFSTGLPITAILVPVYAMFARFNLVNNQAAVIFFLAATSLPFGIWLMKGFMDGVPLDLEQAAWVDGASWLGSLRRIVAPLMMPGITVITIFTFVSIWGNFFVPFILLESQSKFPAAVSIYTFFSQYGLVDYGQLAAFSILYTLPTLLLWVVAGRFLRGQFSFAGAVKG
jgi:multiple sugar transport system permease protein